ncbi:MAG: hypothetical protein RSC93_01370 [Erysipelotrichaceae bacterium]|jgi:hypothetical protein
MSLDENSLFAMQADILESKMRKVPIIGMVLYQGELIILDALSSMVFEEKIGKDVYDSLPFLSAEQLFDFDELEEHLEDY